MRLRLGHGAADRASARCKGFGAGGVQPIASTILGDIYAPTERGRVQGMVSSVFGVSAVVGPSLGAFLIEQVSWQAVFWVNLPIGAAAIAMLAVFLRETMERRQHRIDLAGLGPAAGRDRRADAGDGAGRQPVAPGRVRARRPRRRSPSRCCCCTSARTPEPMLPLELWRNRIIVLGSLGNCAAGALMMGVSAFLPAYVQGAMGRSAMAGGLVLGAMSVSWALASIAAARIMARTSYRLTAVLGALAADGRLPHALTLDPRARAALGGGAARSSSASAWGLAARPSSSPSRPRCRGGRRGAATSSAMFLRFVGQSLGAAASGAVLNATIAARDPGALGAVNRLLEPASRALLAPAEVARLSALVAEAIGNTYFVAGAFAVAALGLALLMPPGLNPTRHVSQG